MSHPQIQNNQIFENALKYWKFVAPILSYPRNKRDYNELVLRLDKLLDIVGENEQHCLMSLVDALSNVISSYERDHFEKLKPKGIYALKYLMESHHLKQYDFPEIASQGVMSEILSGKRSLNLNQVKKLAKRFNVDPATFIDE